MSLPRFTAEQSLRLSIDRSHYGASAQAGNGTAIQPMVDWKQDDWKPCMIDEFHERDIPENLWNGCKRCYKDSDCWVDCLVDLKVSGNILIAVAGGLHACRNLR
jgi:hypothetical protein